MSTADPAKQIRRLVDHSYTLMETEYHATQQRFKVYCRRRARSHSLLSFPCYGHVIWSVSVTASNTRMIDLDMSSNFLAWRE